MESTLFQFTVPPGLEAVHAPSEVVELHHLGELGILGGASEQELDSVGLTRTAVARHLASLDETAHAQALQTVWQSSLKRSLAWLELLGGRLERLSPGWRSTLTSVWATSSSFLPPKMLLSGTTGIRAGLLMHLTHTGATVFDVQSSVTALSETMAAEKPSLLEKSALLGTSFIGGQALDIFVGGIGATVAGHATSWGQQKLTKQLTAVEPWIEELALTYTLALGLKSDEPALVKRVVEELRESASAISRTQPSAAQTKRIKLLLWTQHALLAEHGEARAAAHVMPNVVGMRLSDAREVLKSIGYANISVADAVNPPQSARTPRIESRWQVRGQLPAEGGPLPDRIVLAFSKPGESLLTAVMHKNMTHRIH